MRRLNLFIDDETFIKLKTLPGTMTEHIKIAIRDYLKDLYKVSASASQSQRKEESDNE